MAHVPAQFHNFRPKGALTLAALGASLLLSACAGTSDLLPSGPYMASNDAKADAASDPASELRAATEYWGKQYKAKPEDKTAALSYAKNLKASGDKRLALDVLRDAASFHGSDPELMGEFGRLALDLDQLSVAARALEIADQSQKPDWRVISARGTVLAKQGQHKAAIPYFERALSLAPGQVSVMNNLAMAHAMSGDAGQAEQILRQAAAQPGATAKINQNLALVLGLQGKYDESKIAGAAAAGSSTIAAENTEYLRRMVKLDPKSSPAPALSTAAAPAPATAAVTTALPWTAKTAPATVARAASTPVNDAFKPAAIESGSSAAAWNTAVTASVQPSDGAAPNGSNR